MQRTRNATLKSPSAELELLLLSMSGREALAEPFEYKLDLLCSASEDLFALLGQALSVELELDGESIREFNGIVSHFAVTGEQGRYTRYEAILRPWLWLLKNTHNCRIFQGKTTPAVVQEIFREHGITDFRDALSFGYRSQDYLVQYRESDLDFVNRILEQEGIYYFFEHAGGKHVLVLADSLSAHTETRGYESLSYVPAVQGQVRPRDHLDGWFLSRQLVPASYSARGFDFELRGGRVKTGSAQNPYVGSQSSEVFDYPGTLLARSDAQEHARIRLEEAQAHHELARGGGSVRGLKVGSLFTLRDYPREDQNKQYLVLETTFQLHVDSYESVQEPSADEECRCEFVALDSKRPFRPARRTRKPVVEGPQTAIVVGPAEQEIWTDEYGRVKLQFHWDRYGKSDQTSSCWVRVAQLWAGSGFGGMHIPRVGQEVIVDFLEGDPDSPIVVGRVYNADNLPPYGLPASQTQSGIKSRSSKGGSQDNGNEIRFEDKRGQEELYIQAERDQNIVVKHDQGTTIGVKQSVSVGAIQTVSVGAEQLVSVGANQTVSVGANRTLSVGANDTTLVLGLRDVIVTGAESHTTKGERTETYEAGRSVTVTQYDSTTVKGGDKTTTVSGAYGVGADSFAVDAKSSMSLSCPSGSLSAGPAAPGGSGGGPASLLTLVATDGLLLQCGSNSIYLSKDGITISSTASVAAFVGDNALDLATDGSTLSGKNTTVASDGITDITGGKVNLRQGSAKKSGKAR